jgi:hypothetical protein
MKERPIILVADEVRAILAGRKTQLRRPLKLPAGCELDGVTKVDCGNEVYCHKAGEKVGKRILAWPYVPGERLWVREAFTHITGNGIQVWYRADGEPCDVSGRAIEKEYGLRRWAGASRMQRHESRLTIEVTAVRVERLQAITEEDARAEGVETGQMMPACINGEPGQVMMFEARRQFAWEWDLRHGKRAPWSSDPFVWVVSFRRVEVTAK